ncbi:MAG TPA: hypothetical protein VJ624_01130, partial [Thermodesulfobacteriota bacterium]|nr:hypothetical protein [Thermodesulfobacteriota bacterium]
LWGLAHFTSAPGGNVSLFWGLVQYTKNNPSASLATTTKNQEPSTSSVSLSATTPSQSQEPSTTTSSAVPDDLGAMYGITKKTLDKTLQSVRAKRRLRPLEALESGRSVAETARGTYFFIPITYLNVSSGKMVEKLSGIKVSRFRDGDWYYEVHLPKTGAAIIMAFTHESDAVRLGSPKREIRKISVAAVPWEKMTSLVSLPADHVIAANERTLNISERERVDILDLEIQ